MEQGNRSSSPFMYTILLPSKRPVRGPCVASIVGEKDDDGVLVHLGFLQGLCHVPDPFVQGADHALSHTLLDR